MNKSYHFVSVVPQNTKKVPTVTFFGERSLRINRSTFSALSNPSYIEVLLDEASHVLYIRPANSESQTTLSCQHSKSLSVSFSSDAVASIITNYKWQKTMVVEGSEHEDGIIFELSTAKPTVPKKPNCRDKSETEKGYSNSEEAQVPPFSAIQKQFENIGMRARTKH